jgi:hypothetical protein
MTCASMESLAVDFLPGGLGEIECLEPLPQLLDLRAFVSFTELLTDRLELLPQEHLALTLAQLFLNLGLDVLLGVEYADLALNVHEHAPQPVLHRQRLEQALALRWLDLEVAGHQIREPAGVGNFFEHLPHDLLGETRFLAQLRGALPRLAVQADERRILGVQGRHIVDLVDHCFEVAAVVGVVHRRTPMLAVQQQLHATQPALDLADLGDRPRGIKHRGGDGIDVLPLCDGEDEAGVALQRSFDGAQGGRTPRADRRGHSRKQHDLPERKHRERQSVRHRRINPSDVGDYSDVLH